MNNKRRKALNDACKKLYEASAILESIITEEEEAYGNLPENLQNSSRGEAMEETLETLNESFETLIDMTTAFEEL